MGWKPDYITGTELTGYVRVGDAVDATYAAQAATAASRAIDKHTNRQFGQLAAPAQWAYTAYWDDERGLWVVPIDDLQDITGFAATIDGGDAIDAYTLEPRNAVDQGKAYTRLAVKSTSTGQPTGADDEVLITVKWGWTAFPTAVKQAAELQGSRFLARRDSPYGIAGSPQVGSELRLLARVDPDVAVSLADYVRPRGTA